MSGEDDVSKVCELYYEYTSALKKYKRRYLTRKFLLTLSTEVDREAIHKMKVNVDYDGTLPSPETFVKLTRVLLRHFVGEVCPLGLVTSKKIRKDLVPSNLGRLREIRRFLRQRLL